MRVKTPTLMFQAIIDRKFIEYKKVNNFPESKKIMVKINYDIQQFKNGD